MSRRARPEATLYALALAWAWLCVCSLAHADTALRVLILGGDRDAALLARVDGQVADLAATVEHAPLALPAAALPVQLAAARRLARTHTADAVVWFAHDGADWIVYVADAAGDRVLVRRVQSGGGEMSSSAAIEAAAMIVRTAVRGLAAGGEIGVVAEPEPAPEPAPPPPPPVAPPDAGPDLGGVRPLRPFATVAWSGLIDGEAAAGHHGVGARLGVAGGPWRFALGLAHHPATTFTGTMASIAVERQALAVALGVDVAGGAQRGRAVRWRIGAEVALGMTRFARTTTTTSNATVTPTADRATWSPTATPALHLARRVGRGAWIELALGADLIAGAPEFGVATPEGFASIARLWPVEPHLGLGIVVDPF